MENIKFHIEPSKNKTKKFTAFFTVDGELVYKTSFGSKPYQDYTQHHNKERRKLYISRHKSRENWDIPFSNGSLSRFLLWGDSIDLNENIKTFKKKFNLI
jgi:hypothetical protein